MAKADGTLRKTNKAGLATELEKHVSPTENIPTESTCIIDAMLLIQRINGCNKTFTQLADSALQMVLVEGMRSQRIDVVFDVYEDISIKNLKRCSRGATTGNIQYKNITGGNGESS